MEDFKTFNLLKENFSIKVDEEPAVQPPEFLSIASDNVVECFANNIQIHSSRRSLRELFPFDYEKLASVLYHSCRVESTTVTKTGYLKTFRPFPSAGGRHPIELLCFSSGVKNLENGAWYFDPYKVALYKINLPAEYIENIFIQSAKLLESEFAPPIVLLSVAVLNRTLSRYKNGIGLIWRDTGNMFSTISDVAQIHELGSCQLGFSSEFSYAEVLGLKKQNVWITGGLALGAPDRGNI